MPQSHKSCNGVGEDILTLVYHKFCQCQFQNENNFYVNLWYGYQANKNRQNMQYKKYWIKKMFDCCL